jgi:hypothetical protein
VTVRSIPPDEAAALPKPGSLVHVRHRVYLVEAVHPSPDGKHMTRLELVCLDDDNQGRRLEVLWELELGARRLDPASHGLGEIAKLDPPRHFAAYLNAIKWNCVTATDAKLFQAPFRAGIQIQQHQLAPLRKALALPRANLFIADDVGLGKTIEAGLVIQELILRQRLDFVVIVVPATITLQWRDEMERRFGLRFEIYNRDFVARRRRERGFAVNPWSTHNRFIISYQTLRRPEYCDPLLHVLGERSRKSMLVLDEAHTVAPASASKYATDSDLTRVARDIAGRFENRLFLSATPHNGHSNSFSALLEILDPQRFTRGVKISGPHELEPIMVRRLKRDLRALGTEGLPDRKVIEIPLVFRDGHWHHQHASGSAKLGPGTDAELRLSELLASYAEHHKPKSGRGKLVFVNLQKRLLSSVEAFFRTLTVHLKTVARYEAANAPASANASTATTTPQPTLTPAPEASSSTPDSTADLNLDLNLDEDTYGRDDDTDVDEEVRIASKALPSPEAAAKALLEQMRTLAAQARHQLGAKALALLDWIRHHQCEGIARGDGSPAARNAPWRDTRVIVFTEYADTKRHLLDVLHAAIDGTHLAEARIAVLHGGMSDDQRQFVQSAFNGDPREHPVRILIATDAAREGVNLQGFCADLIHFDIPWNPARIEQRNGRIDRTLQPSPEVRCHYFTQPQRPEDRVLATLVGKVERIQRELGSLSQVVMARIEDALADGIDAHTERRLDAADAERAETLAAREELDPVDPPEKAQAKLRALHAEREACGQMEEASRRQMDFDPRFLQDAIAVGLELAGLPTPTAVDLPTKPATTSASKSSLDAEHLFQIPDLPKSWANTLDSLRPPRRPKQDFLEWRKQPLLPVAYRPGKHLTLDRVHLHLQHPFVQRVMSRFLAQGYAAHDLSRVTVVRTSYAAAIRVVAFGRISLFGRGGTRLHDKVVRIVAPWSETQGADHLVPLSGTAASEASARFEDALREAPDLESIPKVTQTRLLSHALGDFAALWPHVEAEAEREEQLARKRLAQRAEVESSDMDKLLSTQRDAIERALRDGEQRALDFGQGEAEQERQFKLDQRYMRERLASIELERARETASIRLGYDVMARRIEPLGLVYLWPSNR